MGMLSHPKIELNIPNKPINPTVKIVMSTRDAAGSAFPCVTSGKMAIFDIRRPLSPRGCLMPPKTW